MAITVLTRWSTPNAAETTEVAKRAKALWIKNGAQDVRLNQIYTGEFTGQYILAAVFADMAAYAKALAVTQPDLAPLLAENARLGAVMHEREILISVDI